MKSYFFGIFILFLAFSASAGSPASWEKPPSFYDYFSEGSHPLKQYEFEISENQELVSELDTSPFVVYDKRKYGEANVVCMPPKQLLALRGVKFPGASFSVAETNKNAIVSASSISSGPVDKNTLKKVAVVTCLKRVPEQVFVDFGRGGIDSDFRRPKGGK